MQLLSAEKETWLAGDVRRLTLKIAAPSVAAMVASAFCSLLETLILGRSDAQLSAAIGACFALTALEQTVGFTLGMGARQFRQPLFGLRKQRPRPPFRVRRLFCGAGDFLYFPRRRSVLCRARAFSAQRGIRSRPRRQSMRVMSACVRRCSAVR